MAKRKTKQITPLGEKLTKLEQPVIIKRMIIALGLFCLLLFLLDFFHFRHGKVEIEHLFGFYGFAGYLAFAFIIFSTAGLKKLIGRKETYYSPNVVDGEKYPPEELERKEHGDD